MSLTDKPTGKETFLKIPALGRNASLGFLYDERSDEFRDVFVFKSPIEEPSDAMKVLSESRMLDVATEIKPTAFSVEDDATAIQDNSESPSIAYPKAVVVRLNTPYSNIRADLANTYEEKFKLMDISASLKANILSGMLTVEGSAGYIKDTNKTSQEVTGVMTLECHTIEEKLQIYYDSLKPFYNTELINYAGATHILTGIKYGANVSIQFSDTAINDKDKQTIKGHLKVQFEKLKGMSIEAEASVDIEGNEKSSELNYSISVRGDILLPNSIPTTHKEVRELITQVPKLMQKQTVGGRGVPVEFTLTPLAPLRKHLRSTARENQLVQKLDDALLSSFVGMFDMIIHTEQELHDINDKIQAHPVCVSREVRLLISKVRGDFLREKTRFTTLLKETMIAVRSGTLSDSALSDLVSEYTENAFSPYNISTKIDYFESTLKKIAFHKTSQNSYNDIEYFGQGSSLEASLLGSIKDVVYILYTKPEFSQNDPEDWEECKKIFFQTLYKPFNKLFIVDCDFDFPGRASYTRTVLQQIVHGMTTIQDVNDELKKSQSADPIHTKAIGRFAQMGQIYDARKDTFLEDRFLKVDYPKSLLKITPHDINETNIIPSESYQDKFGILGVEVELQFSILAGMTQLTRSGKYLSTSIEGSAISGKQKKVLSILHTRRLDEVEIKVKDPNFWKALAIDAVDFGATHFVTKIEYGFNTIFSVEDKSQFLENASDGASLKQYVQNLKEILSGIQIKTKAPKQPSEDAEKTQGQVLPLLHMDELDGLQGDFQITVFSDIQGERSNPDVLDNRSELLDYLNHKFIPRLSTTAEKKNEMGVPIAYKLYPLANLAHEIGALTPYIPYGTFLGAEPSSLVKILHEIETANCQIESFAKRMQQGLEFVTDTDFATLKNIREKYKSTIKKYRDELRQLVRDIKSGSKGKTLEDYTSVLERYEEEGYFHSNGNYAELARLKLLGEKLHFLQKVKEMKIEAMGREETTMTLEQLLMENISSCKIIYLLYYNPCWVREYAESWKETMAFFFNTLPHSNCGQMAKFFVVNCEFEHFSSKHITQPVIQEYTGGKLTSVDVEHSDGKWEGKPCAQMTLAQITEMMDEKLKQLSENTKEETDKLKGDLTEAINNLETGLLAKLNTVDSETVKLEADVTFTWRHGEGDIPFDAVEGGTERGKKLYIIRSEYEEDVISGKFHSESYLAWIGHKGKPIRCSSYEFLTGPPSLFEWIPSNGSHIPENAIRAGSINYNGAKVQVYIGRCHWDGEWRLGAVTDELYYFAHDSTERTSSEFEVLGIK